MHLMTAVVDRGLALGVVKDGKETMVSDLTVVEVPSERYLQEIERVVAEAGGWNVLDTWHVRTTGESFTSLRGLVSLVNILAPLHGLELVTFTQKPAQGKGVETPIDPTYAGEPNISSS